MEPSYSTSSEDSIQSTMPFYYASYPPTSDFELPFQPTSSPPYAPSYASSFSASSYNSPAFSTCDYTTPPLAYSAQAMQTNNATYFAPMQSHCVWSAAAAPVSAAVASAGAMPPVEKVLITDADEVDMDLETDLDLDLQQQYLMDEPKPMPAPTVSMQMPMSIPTDFHTSPSACSSPIPTSPSSSGTKPFSCDCGRAFTRPADLKRHQTSVHNPVFQDCPVEECLRKAGNGFPRRDHLIEHLRSYHHWDVPKRRAVRKGMKVST
ncbi:uncharacterized protein KD926_000646 [Aspergillus affinis]|uniref:uncharacterized protein n=1 Tax=Aspergillus affinis TaxID=1070780 RepID=UPI0022FDC977|nr:uncharacterized protein KD926_000646 [Aspergillus affinis]KAI9037284.1 hypothetical protein KD926_000646 [Aspergillus affinis]